MSESSRSIPPIIHTPGCGWETGPYCTCGADPGRAADGMWITYWRDSDGVHLGRAFPSEADARSAAEESGREIAGFLMTPRVSQPGADQ